MAWWAKKKDPRKPRERAERLEIPPDVWEKCEACGHTDLREKFVRNLNVCPACDYHRRLRAHEYVSILLDEGSSKEVEANLRSTDPLGFPEYPARLKKASASAGSGDAMLAASGTLGDMPVNLGVMDYGFMGGSMGSVVGEKIAGLGRRAHAGGRAVAHANGQGVGVARAARRAAHPVRVDPHQPDDGRRQRE